MTRDEQITLSVLRQLNDSMKSIAESLAFVAERLEAVLNEEKGERSTTNNGEENERN